LNSYSSRERLAIYDRLENGLHHLYRRKDMSAESREVLIDALNRIAWDDAVHIAAPWEPRSSLCGSWDRNLVTLDDPRPDGMAGCWTCLMAAEWFDKNAASGVIASSTAGLTGEASGEGNDPDTGAA
jgi:hypothetical protein